MATITIREETMEKMKSVKRFRHWNYSACIDIWASRELLEIKAEKSWRKIGTREVRTQDAPGRMIAVNPPPLNADERK